MPSSLRQRTASTLNQDVGFSLQNNKEDKKEEQDIQGVPEYWEMRGHCSSLLFTTPYPNLDLATSSSNYHFLEYVSSGQPDQELVRLVRQAHYKVLASLNDSELQVRNFILPVKLMKMKYIDPFSRQRIVEDLCTYLTSQRQLRSVVLEQAAISFSDLCRILLALSNNSHVRRLYLWNVLEHCLAPFKGPLQSDRIVDDCPRIPYTYNPGGRKYLRNLEKAKRQHVSVKNGVSLTFLKEINVLRKFYSKKSDSKVPDLEENKELENVIEKIENIIIPNAIRESENIGWLEEMYQNVRMMEKYNFWMRLFSSGSSGGHDHVHSTVEAGVQCDMTKNDTQKTHTTLTIDSNPRSDTAKTVPTIDSNTRSGTAKTVSTIDSNTRTGTAKTVSTIDSNTRTDTAKTVLTFDSHARTETDITAFTMDSTRADTAKTVISTYNKMRLDVCTNYLKLYENSEIKIDLLRDIYKIGLSGLTRLTTLSINYGLLADGTGEALLAIGSVTKGRLQDLELLCHLADTPSPDHEQYDASAMHPVPDLAWKRLTELCPRLRVHLICVAILPYDIIKQFISRSIPLHSFLIDHGFCPTITKPQITFSSTLKSLYQFYKNTLKHINIVLWHVSGRIDNSLETFIKEATNIRSFGYSGPLHYKETMNKLCDAALRPSSQITNFKVMVRGDPCFPDRAKKLTADLYEQYLPKFNEKNIKFMLGAY